MKFASKAIISLLAVFALAAAAPGAFAADENGGNNANVQSNNAQVTANENNRNDADRNVTRNDNDRNAIFGNRFDSDRNRWDNDRNRWDNDRNRSGNWNNWGDRDRFIRNNRFIRGNTIYLGGTYNRYVPYTFYTRYLPNYSNNAILVIIDRDYPNRALVIGNTAYNGSNYNNVVVVRVSHRVYLMLQEAVQYNWLSNFRFDRDRNYISFVTPKGAYQTTDFGVDNY